MYKKKILKKMLIASISLFVIFATHVISVEYYRNYGKYHEDAKIVCKLPDTDRYISIHDWDECIYNILNWHTYGYQIMFTDSDGFPIYSSYLNSGYNIVKYKDKYYIHEDMYEYLLKEANIIAEQRNRIYKLGEAVMVRGGEIVPYVIIIDSVETRVENDHALSTIKFTANPDISESKIEKIFDQIETDKGKIIDEFVVVDIGTVQVKHSIDEKTKMIVLKNPDTTMWGKQSIRKVSVDG